MKRKTIEVTLTMEKYVAHPYWPEREFVIRMQKDSGMNRQKSEEKRQAALKAQVEKSGFTLDDYRAAEAKARREWYRAGDKDDGNIIIPRHQLAGALVETVGRVPKALRGKFDKDSFRHFVQIGDFTTGKKQADGVYSRYVKLETSNMRSHQTNEYLEDFAATGEVSIPDDVKSEDVQRLFAHAIGTIGVGACRKMGFGRGEILAWEEVE